MRYPKIGTLFLVTKDNISEYMNECFITKGDFVLYRGRKNGRVSISLSKEKTHERSSGLLSDSILYMPSFDGLERADKISWESFCDIFKPVKNGLVDDSSFNGYMFETYGVEVEHVKTFPINNIWTIYDPLGRSFFNDISTGFHYVNRMGYIVTEVPWPDEYECAINVRA